MGFFDAFKRQPKKKEINTEKVNQAEPMYTMKQSPEGRIQIDYSTPEKAFKEFYDTTRIIIDNKPININGKFLTQALVSWYGSDDCIRIDKETNRELSRRNDYKRILTQIDVNALLNNPKYSYAVMNNLLDQARVTRYLYRGLENHPSQACGNYIGSIAQRGGEYVKVFDAKIGEIVHDMPDMVERRKEFKRIQEYSIRKEIEKKQKEMENKQKEMEELKRKMEDMQR